MSAAPFHWDYQTRTPRDDSGRIAAYDPAAECPFKVNSMREITPGIPALTDEAMGWLAYTHRRTTVLGAGKWGKDDAVHNAFDNFTGDPIDNYYRYDLTFSAFSVALMAEQTPAWREAYTDFLDVTLQRFMEYWTFFDWLENSGEDPNRLNYPDWWYDVLMPKGFKGKYDSPGWGGNGTNGFEYDPDPVRANGHCNVMYKGYLSVLVGLYGYISGDDKYDHPFKITYDDSTSFEYDATRLTELIANQFYSTPSGLSCEVTKAFGWCNNVAGMGLRLHDIMHGTDHATAYYEFLPFLRKNYMVGGEGNGPIERYALYHDMSHKFTLNESEHQFAHNFLGTSVNGAGMDQALFRRLYEGGMNQFFCPQEDGSGWVTGMPGMGIDFHYATATGFAASKEWGDTERNAALRNWITKTYEPTWDTELGEFYHLMGLGEKWPRAQFNNWLALGYVITEPGQWANIFKKPNTAKFRQPTIVGVDFPTVRPRQAYWDAEQRALIVSITSCDKAQLGEPTSFTVTNLLPGSRYRLTADGVPGDEVLEPRGGEIRIDTKVGAHNLVLQQLP